MNTPVRIALCTNTAEVEYASGKTRKEPCEGELTFAPGEAKAQCPTCETWCSAKGADFVDPLRDVLAAVVASSEYRSIVFCNPDDAPIGSVGFLSPGGLGVTRTRQGWNRLGNGERLHIDPDSEPCTFTSQSGPANDAKLIELLIEALVPKDGLLVSFGTESGNESADWNPREILAWTFLAAPKVLAHRLGEEEMSGLAAELEDGGFIESDAYSDFESRVGRIAHGPAQRYRDELQRRRGFAFEVSNDS